VEVKLPETIEECHQLIGQLCSVIKQMQVEIDELKAQLKQNSQNSHRPPSSDNFQKPNPKPAVRRKKKKRGGQKGHRGETLKKVANPDVVVDCEPLGCVCGGASWVGESEILETRQVFELPEPRLEVSEYRRIKRTCECGWASCGEFPEKISGQTQYGERVQAIVSLLSVQGCLSHRKIGELFADLYGYQLNEATIQEMLQRTSQVMPMEKIKLEILQAKVINVDETSLRENGIKNWLHTASTKDWSYQFAHPKRGREAMESEKSVLPQYRGVVMHDCLESYFGFCGMKHGICDAHILRELTGIIENSKSRWGWRMKRLLLRIYVASDYGNGTVADFAKYEERYDKILAEGETQEPPPERNHQKGKLKRTKGRNLLERMRKHKEAILRFAVEKEVPFTNNQAERDLRNAKVKQKMNGGFRAASGTESYVRINSYLMSLRKQGRQVFQELVSIIKGKPFATCQT
jgi:transposase